MEYFRRLKNNILTVILIFCTLPLSIAGGYVIYLSFKYDERLLLILGALIIGIALFTLLFSFYRTICRLKPIKNAAERLHSTLSEEESEIINATAEGDPAKFLYVMVDYIAGKRMTAGSSKQQRDLFNAAAECTDEIIWRRDEEGDNYFIPEIWKIRYPEIMLENGTPLENYIHPDNVAEFRDALEVMTAKPGRKSAMNLQLKAGEKYISVGITACSSEIGGMICCAGAFVDSEKIAEFENAIEEKYTMYMFALKAVSDIIYEVSVPEDKFVILNPARWNAMFDLPLNGDFSFHRSSYAQLIHSDNLEGFKDRFGNYDHLLYMPDKSITYDYRIRHKNQDWIWVRHSITAVKDEDGKVLKVIGLISDINEKKRQEFREMYDHKHDALTGAFLRSTLEAEFNEAVRIKNKPVMIMMVDIDRFSEIVDYYGHRTGDLVLRRFVQTIWECQLGRCGVGRVGNDDFVVIMKEPEDVHSPECMAQRIFEHLAEPYVIENQQIVLTASIGWVEYGVDGTAFDDLINKAELACLKAHHIGKNRCLRYGKDMGEEK